MTASQSASVKWAHCVVDEDAAAPPSQCLGEQVTGYDRCLAHLSDDERADYFATLAPGSEITHRGTTITPQLLSRLTTAVSDPQGTPIFGDTRFDEAEFVGLAEFGGAEFVGDAWFDKAKFCGIAGFGGAKFARAAWFTRTEFVGIAGFVGTEFVGIAEFVGAEFGLGVGFGGANFGKGAGFGEAKFSRSAWFDSAKFGGAAGFGGTRFAKDAWLTHVEFTTAIIGPVVCQGTLSVARSTFTKRTTLEIAAHTLDCTRTTWSSTATLRIRHARVDLTDAILGAPLAVTAHRARFANVNGDLLEGVLGEGDAPVRIVSVSGVDATNLVLTDVDLDECVFTGAFHLDRLRLEGRVRFAQPPAGWQRRSLALTRWSRRRTLAEEHLWRHATKTPGWNAPPTAPRGPAPLPDGLAVTYRALRKALEDRGDAPGAADFYYGEMEARRHDDNATRVERGLLHAYWLLSGYGLRASRALTSLLVAMTATVALMVLFGLPATTPGPVTIGVPAPDGRIVSHTATPDAVLPPWRDRVDGQRVGDAIPAVLNAVIFRAADDDLTTPGVYLDMAARLLEPSLLVLAVLALRGRVKR
jgi:hypothetical protein